MKIGKYLLVGLFLLDVTLAFSGEIRVFPINAYSTVLLATNTGKSVELVVPAKQEIHWHILANLSMEPRDRDEPRRVTLSGQVKSINNNSFSEQIPLFFGSDLHGPRLAAITDSRGSFSFNVTIKEDTREGYLECSSITNGAIYIGNFNIYRSDTFDGGRNLTSGLTRKYALEGLLSSTNIYFKHHVGEK